MDKQNIFNNYLDYMYNSTNNNNKKECFVNAINAIKAVNVTR